MRGRRWINGVLSVCLPRSQKEEWRQRIRIESRPPPEGTEQDTDEARH